MTKTLEQIEVGDRVWVGNGRAPRNRLETVAKLTPTQIVLAGGDRYRRDRHTRIGSGGHYYRIVTAIATPAECTEWDAEEARRVEEAEARKAERDRVEATRDELNRLLPGTAYVSESSEPGTWEVTIRHLSETDVRSLAGLLKDARLG